MEEMNKLYKVDDVAKMTGLTSRTIRNYLKDGSLEGRKIGGQWRFTMENIENLFSNGKVSKEIMDQKRKDIIDFVDGVNTEIEGQIQVCSIIDYYCDSEDEAKSMADIVMKKINDVCEEGSYKFKFDYDYIQKESKARFTFFGEPEFIVEMMELFKKEK